MSQSVGWAELDLPLKLNIQAAHLSNEQFLQLCQENPDLRIEMNAREELVIMPPTGMKTGMRNHTLALRLGGWTEQDGSGLAFASSTMFTLPNGAKRSPDASWVKRERWNALTEKQQEGTDPLCPDFVVELRLPSRSPPYSSREDAEIYQQRRAARLVDRPA